jgi:hypothetical protein
MRADHTIATTQNCHASHSLLGCCEPCAADAHLESASHSPLGVGGRSQIGAVT